MISEYLKRIVLFDPSHMMSVTNLIAIGVKALKMYIVYSLEKEYIKLIFKNL